MLLIAAPAPLAPTLARIVALAAPSAAYGTDTLAPPTSLAASGGASAVLTWTPTGDGYASGYLVYRSATSGSGYAQVGTRTPVSSTGHTDVPPTDGTYFYVVRSFLSNWTSVATAEVSAIVRMGVTGFRACAAQAAETGGDGNGYEGASANGCAPNGAAATDANSGTSTNTTCANIGKDRHRFTTFGFALPAVVTSVNGITVRVRLGLDATAGTNRVCAELSSNNGVTYTAAQQVDVTSTALTTYTLGGPANLWGRAWTPANFSDANFRVRLTDVSSVTTRDFSLDSVEVQVNYTP